MDQTNITSTPRSIPCRLCNAPAAFVQPGKILDFDIAYFECGHCGYVQTESPHWLDHAYTDAINACDTGILVRNIRNARIVIATLLALGQLHETVVDYAGGYGILVRLLRDHGIDAYWLDRYCQNQVARGFEYQRGPAALVTAFEAFEHFVDPAQEFATMLEVAPNILISTELIATPTPAQSDWWYFGSDHGQHIGFYRMQTLQWLARKFDKHLLTDGRDLHLFLDKPLSDIVWRIVIRFNRLLPAMLRPSLKSRTWADHYTLSGRR